MLLAEEPYSVYLHIPFCQIKCSYCAFNTYIHLEAWIEPFVEALIREIRWIGRLRPGHGVKTVYFGGGTPSLLHSDQISAVLQAVCGVFSLLPEAEISLEANPGDVSPEYLSTLRMAGVNRLSIGMQSSNQNELDLFSRRHGYEDVVQAVAAARKAGFDNVNLDLIYGFPGQTLDTWQHSLQQALALRPEHVSLYALGLEDGTALQSWVRHGRLPAPDDDLAADMYDLADALLSAAGYEQYEISNWSKPGYECRHNLQYWRNLPYPGLGPGAHGFVEGVRYWTILSPLRYVKALRCDHSQLDFPRTPATDQAVVVDRETEIVETLLMGLRLTGEGIQRRVFQERFGADLLDLHGDVLRRHADAGLLTIDDHHVKLTRRGRLLSNVIFRDLV